MHFVLTKSVESLFDHRIDSQKLLVVPVDFETNWFPLSVFHSIVKSEQFSVEPKRSFMMNHFNELFMLQHLPLVLMLQQQEIRSLNHFSVGIHL